MWTWPLLVGPVLIVGYCTAGPVVGASAAVTQALYSATSAIAVAALIAGAIGTAAPDGGRGWPWPRGRPR